LPVWLPCRCPAGKRSTGKYKRTKWYLRICLCRELTWISSIVPHGEGEKKKYTESLGNKNARFAPGFRPALVFSHCQISSFAIRMYC
jgi:hypothetical protein